MTNQEIVQKLINIDKKIELKQQELELLRIERYTLKSQIKADNIEVEEFMIKQKILGIDKKKK